MRNIMLALAAASLMAPVGATWSNHGISVGKNEAEAQRRHKYREWRGRDGRRYCRHSDGTTGLLVGGVGGALLGNQIAGRGDKTLGTVLGGVAGAFGGRAIDRASTADRRCR